jgi:hypothetical protein
MMSGCRLTNSWCKRLHPIDVNAAPTKVHPHVAAIAPTQVRKRLRERRGARLPRRIVFVARYEHADAPHAPALLRAHRERPSRRAAEPSNDFPPPKANVHLPLPSPMGALSRQKILF